MSQHRARLVSLLSVGGFTAAALAIPPVIDGRNIPTEFGAANRLAVQRFQTGFGDHLDPSTSYGSGSELDAMYVSNDGTYLYVGLTGNLENNGNSMMLFIDKDGTGTGSGANPLYTQLFGAPIDSLPRMLAGNPGSGLNNVTFDSGFSPNYCLSWSGGSPVGSQLRTYYLVNWTELAIGADPYNHSNTIAGMVTEGIPNASGPAGTLGPFLSTGTLGILGGSDNTNVVGVEGAYPPGLAINDPNSATTGFEFAIPLSLIGNPAPGSSVCLFAIVSSSDGYMSNMYLPTDDTATTLNNVGNPPFDFATINGNQYACYTIATTVGCPHSGCECVDTNGDCQIDLSDLAATLAVYGQTGSNLAGDCAAPIGQVSLGDIALMLSKYGLNCN